MQHENANSINPIAGLPPPITFTPHTNRLAEKQLLNILIAEGTFWLMRCGCLNIL